MKLFSKFKLGNIELQNRVVMAPLTRSRAENNIPNQLMNEYYGQRASAGLIITEGTAPSANGLGYPRIPGIYNEEQISTWSYVGMGLVGASIITIAIMNDSNDLKKTGHIYQNP